MLRCVLVLLAVFAPPTALAAERPSNMSFDAVLEAAAGGPDPDAQVPYGEDALQFGELWLPAEPAGAVLVVLVHGGCWQNAFDVGHSRPLARALRDQGHAVWSIEYRRLGDDGGGWPGTLEDVAKAVDFATSLIDEHELDAERVVFTGHSAGGHLALWAAARPAFAEDHRFHAVDPLEPAAVIPLAAISDLALYAAGGSSCESAAAEFLAGDMTRVPYASPVEGPFPAAPVVMIQGDADTIVGMDQVQAYLAAAQAADARAVARIVGGAGHFDLIHPDSIAWPVLRATLEQLVGADG